MEVSSKHNSGKVEISSGRTPTFLPQRNLKDSRRDSSQSHSPARLPVHALKGGSRTRGVWDERSKRQNAVLKIQEDH